MFFEVLEGRKLIKSLSKSHLKGRCQSSTQKCPTKLPTWLQHGFKLGPCWVPKSSPELVHVRKMPPKMPPEKHPKTPDPGLSKKTTKSLPRFQTYIYFLFVLYWELYYARAKVKPKFLLIITPPLAARPPIRYDLADPQKPPFSCGKINICGSQASTKHQKSMKW